MACCSLTYQKWTAFGFFVLFMISGCLLIFFWEDGLNTILNKELSLANRDTYQYKYWKETPFDIILKVYLFNWTNSDDEGYKNGWVKPEFKECGPYMYAERHYRKNVVYNKNGTISFNTMRIWKFLPNQSTGSLSDNITTFNPIVLAIANVARTKHFLVQKGVGYFFRDYNITLRETKNVSQFMFNGIDDILVDIARKLNIKGFNIPYDKFGWFYPRNGSVFYDGNYTMWTGEDDIEKTGIVTEWNGSNVSTAYIDECAKIDGSTGEVWNPVKNSNSISIFLSDSCSKLRLERNGQFDSNGIEGNLYVSTDKLFDNGRKYKEMKCFSPHYDLPTGVRNISECKFKAPAFLSLPHFNLADPEFVKNVSGMRPNPNRHKISFVIEPNLGLPLEANVTFQANLMLYNLENIEMFRTVKDTMIPVLWVEVSAGVPEDYRLLLKFIIAAPAIGLGVGFLLVLVGVTLLTLYVFLDLRQMKREEFKI